MVLAIGAEEDKSMNRKIAYKDGPIDEVEVVADFLPSPKQLKLKSQNTKVTISLSSESVEYFKAEAKKHDIDRKSVV